MRVLVLGASGMLGNAVYRYLAQDTALRVYGSTRSSIALKQFAGPLGKNLLTGADVENPDALVRLFAQARPDVVVNCIGLVKQLAEVDNPLVALPINALLPHRIAHLCELSNARFIHISTDCVFSGSKGNYKESDIPDARDLYGRSKLLGEVDYPHAITLRTSIIGHELNSAHGLVGWFLSQEGGVKGFTKAFFSGLPTVELARVIRDFVLSRTDLHGVYHVSSDTISKYSLLDLVNREYRKDLRIDPDDKLQIDRSLDSERFKAATGYSAPPWPQMVAQMRVFQ